jgi:hypothetical protein
MSALGKWESASFEGAMPEGQRSQCITAMVEYRICIRVLHKTHRKTNQARKSIEKERVIYARASVKSFSLNIRLFQVEICGTT